MHTIALADDHQIFCDSLKALINDLDGFNVLWTAGDRIRHPIFFYFTSTCPRKPALT